MQLFLAQIRLIGHSKYQISGTTCLVQTIDWFQSCDTCMYHISLCGQLQNKEQLSDQVTLLFIAQYVLTSGLVASISKFKIPQGKKQ